MAGRDLTQVGLIPPFTFLGIQHNIGVGGHQASDDRSSLLDFWGDARRKEEGKGRENFLLWNMSEIDVFVIVSLPFFLFLSILFFFSHSFLFWSETDEEMN